MGKPTSRVVVKGPYLLKKLIERPDVYKRLKQLTNGGWGRLDSTLYYVLSRAEQSRSKRSPEKHGVVYLAWCKGEVIGWSWIQKPKSKKALLGVFVHHTYRKQRIGSRLALASSNHATSRKFKLQVEPWNLAGRRLYYNYENMEFL